MILRASAFSAGREPFAGSTRAMSIAIWWWRTIAPMYVFSSCGPDICRSIAANCSLVAISAGSCAGWRLGEFAATVRGLVVVSLA